MRSLILTTAAVSFLACITLLWADQAALSIPWAIACALCGALMREA